MAPFFSCTPSPLRQIHTIPRKITSFPNKAKTSNRRIFDHFCVYIYIYKYLYNFQGWHCFRIEKSLGFSSRQDTGTPSGSLALTARCGVTKSNLHWIPCSGNCIYFVEMHQKGGPFLRCLTPSWWKEFGVLRHLQYTFLENTGKWTAKGSSLWPHLQFRHCSALYLPAFLLPALHREHLNGASRSHQKIEFNSCCSVLNMELVLESQALPSQLAESPHLFLERSRLHHLFGRQFWQGSNSTFKTFPPMDPLHLVTSCCTCSRHWGVERHQDLASCFNTIFKLLLSAFKQKQTAKALLFAIAAIAIFRILFGMILVNQQQ